MSRSVYGGSAGVLAVGQPLPPVCPSSASCGNAKATDSGGYPSLNSPNNVWNNNIVDGSFGIASPVFLDQLTPSGTPVSTLAVPTSMVNTSFSSKSELSLNLSADGTALTFMAYVAPANTFDVSNANTPMVYDPTNPAGASYFRAVVQVAANGAIQLTPTNSFSGNNGRAAILANGLYYMAGNGNNGSGTPANVVASEGVQVAIPGQALATPPLPIGDFSVSQVINPATGLPYPPDKLGKDNNFRGLTVFNNTLYVTKGSGGNGFNTVYQVGDKGSLPSLANAASAAFTVLPGFPITLAKASGAQYPFGIFFANAGTLYVADEGDGTTANAAASTTSGLQKWVLSNGVWTRVYVLQNGLNLGQPYTIANYPTSLNPATGGLRNIAGKVNGDGTVTIWAVTSTVSANGDQGADPNQLVAIADVLANTSATAAAAEKFTILRTANAGEVLRGVVLAPVAGATPAVNVPLILSATNPGATALSPGSMATAAGQFSTSPSPTVSIVDSTGVATQAPFAAVTSSLITFLVPSTVAPGTAQVMVTSGAVTQTASNVQISTVAPAIYTANGLGLAAAQAIQVSAGNTQTAQLTYQTDSNGATIARPVALSSGTNTYLVLYGTGIAAAGTALTTATINGVAATVVYAGPAGAGSGLDQVNILVPAKLAGAGNANVQLIAEGHAANPVEIILQ
ncbi:MAG: hypothetical protein P4L56_05220 [Candidatus Sulfopaludibacter sp.]|nr:hypothetical protein [Candidatus Sulfopaludibacter sp.]